MTEEKQQKLLMWAILSLSVINFALLAYLVIASGDYFQTTFDNSETNETTQQAGDISGNQTDIQQLPTNDSKNVEPNVEPPAQVSDQNNRQSPNGGVTGNKCGDGTCDAVEKANSSLCPKDCGTASSSAAQPASGTKVDTKKCGDGVCDSVEKDRGLCSADCK